MKMKTVYEMLVDFKRKYSSTICWRLKRHANVIEKHLNPGEEVNYAFAGQITQSRYAIFNTYAIVLTNKRILLAQKRLLFGYSFLAITPDMFNDLTVNTGIIWGQVNIDTIKETVVVSFISKDSVDEIETMITEYMMAEKKKYIVKNEN